MMRSQPRHRGIMKVIHESNRKPRETDPHHRCRSDQNIRTTLIYPVPHTHTHEPTPVSQMRQIRFFGSVRWSREIERLWEAAMEGSKVVGVQVARDDYPPSLFRSKEEGTGGGVRAATTTTTRRSEMKKTSVKPRPSTILRGKEEKRASSGDDALAASSSWHHEGNP